jgi:F0F1-type ATP synthase membrane subunit b/b'
LAIDRQSIERRDFPLGRRGYETEVVDAHLRRVADAYDEAARSAGGGAASLASAASEQVRAIVEAAETSAADITRRAEEEARSIRESADSDAEGARSEAAGQAREHVGKVSEATQVMLQRVDAMEAELGALIESLRTGANRLTADLTLLEGNMGELRGASEGGGTAAAEPADVADKWPADEPPAPVAEPEAPVAGSTPATSDDSEGARLIALNMALNGTPREETDRYLAENFDVADRDALLDEVYARVG